MITEYEPHAFNCPPHSLLSWQLHCVWHIVLVTQGQLKAWAWIQLNRRTEKKWNHTDSPAADPMPVWDQITDLVKQKMI